MSSIANQVAAGASYHIGAAASATTPLTAQTEVNIPAGFSGDETTAGPGASAASMPSGLLGAAAVGPAATVASAPSGFAEGAPAAGMNAAPAAHNVVAAPTPTQILSAISLDELADANGKAMVHPRGQVTDESLLSQIRVIVKVILPNFEKVPFHERTDHILRVKAGAELILDNMRNRTDSPTPAPGPVPEQKTN